MIDITKTYTTRTGKRVVGLQYKPYNDYGEAVTYPFKGTIIRREKPLKTSYAIWDENGRYDVVWSTHNDDLVEVTDGK